MTPPRPEQPADWWGIDHACAGVERRYPTLHWADEPEQGVGPRVAFECDACGVRYAFREAAAAALPDVAVLNQAILDELAVLWGEPSDGISKVVRPQVAVNIVERYRAAILAELEREGD